jgi:hypothetical protein
LIGICFAGKMHIFATKMNKNAKGGKTPGN